MPSAKLSLVDSAPVPKRIAVSLLDFDPENPRFPPDVASGSVIKLIERFVRDERLLELVESIGNQGYFDGEPLLVIPKGKRFVVLEGNRRLAALKLLTGELPAPSGRISIEDAVENAEHRPEEVATLLFSDRSAILRYLGFRHITGIKAWSALQKARYIKRLRNEYFSNLPYEESLRALAKETGSKAPYIGQVLAALALYETAEMANFFDLSIDADEIDFSIISTALSYANIVSFLGLENRMDAVQNGLVKRNLKQVFLWNFVKGESRKSIVKDSRNLKKLAAIVASPAAVKDLSKNGQLDQAFALSKGPAVALAEALSAINTRLGSVWELIPTVGDITPQHVDLAVAINKQARNVRVQLTVALQDAADGDGDD
ncbi:ParB N-terminal domain-containing protein [Xanthomonas axonopodis pv. nakataecorchori]|uniref:ParB N-terminal domain-containing protein n=1 Tax=Xanthomonas axonopodis TaxID=53413 RepID=UPI003530E773